MLTMQAVARELGVDRSALNYYVKDRVGLLEFVARDTFATEFSRFRFPEAADWQTGCLEYARALRDALVSTGSLVAYFRYDAQGGLDMLRPAELLLEKLLSAGFDDHTVAHASLMLANIAMSLARDLIFVRQYGEHPQPGIVHAALDSAPADEFPALRQIMRPDPADYGDAQLELSLRVFTLGMEQILGERRAGASEPSGAA